MFLGNKIFFGLWPCSQAGMVSGRVGAQEIVWVNEWINCSIVLFLWLQFPNFDTFKKIKSVKIIFLLNTAVGLICMNLLENDEII